MGVQIQYGAKGECLNSCRPAYYKSTLLLIEECMDGPFSIQRMEII